MFQKLLRLRFFIKTMHFRSEFNLHNWQLFPEYPVGHRQVYAVDPALPLSIQLPPFTHGLVEHAVIRV